MAHNVFSQQIARRLGSLRQRRITLGGCILFVLLIVLFFSLSNEHASWQSGLFFAGAFSLCVTKSLLAFTTPRAEIQDTGLPWHQQPHILVGILYTGASLLGLLMVTEIFVHNRLPAVVLASSGSMGLLLLLFAYVRGAMLRRSRPDVE